MKEERRQGCSTEASGLQHKGVINFDEGFQEGPRSSAMASRTNMRMMLMREQLQKEEQREKEQQQQAAMHLMQQRMPINTTPAINVSNSIQYPTRPEVPREILKVETHLENPTKYHIQQSQKQQLKQFLSTNFGTKLAMQSLGHAHSPQPSNISPGLRNDHGLSGSTGNSAPNSPMALLNIGCNMEREMDDVIDDIISLESSYNDDVLGYRDPIVQMPNTLPLSSSHMEVYTTHAIAAPTSNSCPANIAIKREISDTEARALAKERQKKDNHNLIERRRRFNINDRIKELGLMIPKSSDLDVRWNKGTILKASVEYIKRLQKDQQRTREMEGQSKRLEMANNHLRFRIQELEMQAQAHGLSTVSPSGLNTPEQLGSCLKDEENPMDALQQQQQLNRHHQQPPQSQADFAQSFGFCDSSLGYADPMGQFTDLSFSVPTKADYQLDDMLMMDDTLSPLGKDPLLSSVSPEASKASSRRSSLSIDDGDML
ncbi:transcription factor EB-like isoform X3 [Amblyraja radiata]|uniref:transcription factor EB-like isoform X3 n=1 Tax=Amblyraja radiata TaxID=386614 RepID=UPI0014040A31|nr:transcription factor EB-like isoform X3 [Amblyraja radiata]